MDLEDEVFGGSARPGTSVGSQWRPGSLGAGAVGSWRPGSFMGSLGRRAGGGVGDGNGTASG